MGLRRLFMPGRYLQCRRIFRRPLVAHYRLAYVPKDPPPFELTFRNGEVWRANPAKLMWDFWDLVLFNRTYELPVSMEHGRLEFQYVGQRKSVRPGTTDFFILKEVYEQDTYRVSDLRDLDVVVDLGAQAGMFATAMAVRARRVICVEAFAGNIEILQRNVGGCPAGDRITIVHRAMARASGQLVPIYDNEGNSGGHSLDAKFVKDSLGNRSRPLASHEVETLGLDDLFAAHDITACDFLKCDIEGGEYDTFDGASDQTLKRVRRLAAEIHGAAGTDDSRAAALEARLRGLGFEVERIPTSHDAAHESWNSMMFAHQPPAT